MLITLGPPHFEEFRNDTANLMTNDVIRFFIHIHNIYIQLGGRIPPARLRVEMHFHFKAIHSKTLGNLTRIRMRATNNDKDANRDEIRTIFAPAD